MKESSPCVKGERERFCNLDIFFPDGHGWTNLLCGEIGTQ